MEPKQYSLTATETRLLEILITGHNANLSAMLSMISAERLGYAVDEHTQFALDSSLQSVRISQKEAEQPPETPTAKALKGKK